MGTGVGNKLDITDLGGGVVRGLRPLEIPENAFYDLRNFISYGKKIIQRPGISPYNTVDAAQNLYGAMSFETSDTTYSIIAGGTSALYRLIAGGGATALTPLVALPTGSSKWRFRQYKNAWFGCRAGGSRLYRGSHSYVTSAGTMAPTVAPTGAEGAAGDLPGGDYKLVYTYAVFDASGYVIAESNYSPEGSVTIADNKTINWSGLIPSSQSHVNGYRIYRTEVDGGGTYYWVADIVGSSVTTYTGDNVLAEDMGDAASLDKGMPITTVKDLELWGERGWLTDGRDVYYSQIGLFDAYSESIDLALIAVNPDDGFEITTLHAFGDKLIVAKQKGLHFITGYSSGTFQRGTISDVHGCVSGDSFKSAQGMAFWFGGDNFYATEGTKAEAIGDIEVRDLVDAIPPSKYDLISAGINPSLGLYLCSIPSATSTYNAYTLAFNYRTRKWDIHEHSAPAASPKFFFDAEDASGRSGLFCGFDGSGRAFQWGKAGVYKDDNTPMVLKFKTGGKDFGARFVRAALTRVHLLHSIISGTATLRAYRDGSNVAYKTRSGLSLDTPREAQCYAFSTLQNGLAGYLQLEFECSDSNTSALEISGLSYEFSVHGRRGRIL